MAERQKAIEELSQVYDVGQITAGHLYDAGFKSLQDLQKAKSNELVVKLNEDKLVRMRGYKYGETRCQDLINYSLIQTSHNQTNNAPEVFTLAGKKFKDLRKRSFESILRLILFKAYKGNIIDFPPIINDSIFIIEDEVRIKFSKIFQDMKEVREFNKICKNWESDNKQRLSQLNDHFNEHVFKSQLTIKDFNALYGSDDFNRTCEYCGITEKNISTLLAAGKIYTKRITTRGRYMEIDRKKPNEDYTSENMAVCCYWCNNAKTDEFSYDDFMTLKQGLQAIWQKRLDDLE